MNVSQYGVSDFLVAVSPHF